MPQNSGQWQGAEGFKIGNPKRVMEFIPLFNLSSVVGAGVGDLSKEILLDGLTGNLKVAVGCGLLSKDNSANTSNNLPTGLYTIQLQPYTTKDGQRVYGREIFQDPTLVGTDNNNHPLPEAGPFTWEGAFTEADGILITIDIPDLATWAGKAVDGTIVVCATVEYNGAWWDVAALTFALAAPKWQGSPEPTVVGTSGG